MTHNGLFRGISIKPKLVVFDLDCTLWPFDCDVYLNQVFHKKEGIIYDINGHQVDVFCDSNYILKSIKDEKDVLLACASRTPTIEVARQLITLNGWHTLFDYMEIYPKTKVKHFQTLQRKTNIPFDQMIFFDDLGWNISEVKGLGVHCHLVPNGINLNIFRKALKEYEQNRMRKEKKFQTS